MPNPVPPAAFSPADFSPADVDADIRLCGNVDDKLYAQFAEQFDIARRKDGPIVLELTTVGGDADLGRRMALELRLLRERQGKEVYFLGKSIVYSAGVTVMSGVPASHRFLTSDTVLLVHERRMEKEVHFSGALRASIAVAQDLLAELENGQRLERAGFEDLVAGTKLSMDALMQKVMWANWYVPAEEALSLGLVAGLI